MPGTAAEERIAKQQASKTFLGINLHLVGATDLSGHNGLGRYNVASQKDRLIFNIVRRTKIDRSYDGVPTGTDTYTGAHVDWKILEGAVAVNENGLEALAAVSGTLGIVTLLKKGKSLFKKVPKLGDEVEKQLDKLIKFLERKGMPKIEITGDFYVHIGFDNKYTPFIRIAMEGKAEIKISQKAIDDFIKKMKIPTSAATGGRSWQINLTHPHMHFPTSVF